MQLEPLVPPCVLFGWWFSPWELWGAYAFFLLFCFIIFSRYFLFFKLDIFFICISNVIPFPGFPSWNPWDFPPPPSASMRVVLHSSTHSTSLPSIPLQWGIYWAFIGPRTSLPIDAWQDHPLLHMQLEPCVFLCWQLLTKFQKPFSSWSIFFSQPELPTF